jgi:cell shape-determining protein MreD
MQTSRILVAVIFLVGLVLHVVVHLWFGFSWRTPRLMTLTIAAIGLRWGSVAGGYLGALAGLILALLSGESPFAGTFALAAAGWLAGEIPSRFAIESPRAIRLAILATVLTELVVVCVARRILPPGDVNALIWAAGWAVVLGPILYKLVVRLSTPPPAQRLPTEPE